MIGHPPEAVSSALFSLNAGRLADVLARLPVGHLWRAFMPGVDAGSILRMLGADAAAVFSDMASSWRALDGGALSELIALPFVLNPSDADLVSLGQALLTDAQALARQPKERPVDDSVSITGEALCWPPEPIIEAALEGRDTEFIAIASDQYLIEIGFHDRSAWMARAYACLDHAAASLWSGALPDPVTALLETPGNSLFPLVPFADADARLRFIEALVDAEASGEPMERFRRSPFRRSAAAGLTMMVADALEAIPGGRHGRAEDGWPIWWCGSAERLEHLVDNLPPGVLAHAAAVRIGIPKAGA